MKTVVLLFVVLLIASVQAQVPKPPASKVDNIREVIHGVEITDPYRWLEDQESPETRAWIDEQNKYTHSLLDGLPMRPQIQKRLSELLRVDSVSTPFEQDGRYFLFKKRAADDLSILYLRQGLNATDEVLIDPHTLSTDHTTDIGLLDASSGGKLIVYSVRRGGQDETELRVMDVDKRKDVDQMPNALYRGVSMKKDGSGFYYNLQRRDTGIRVLYHAIGSDPSKDVEIFGKGYGPDKWIGGSVSEDGKYLLFGVQHGWAKDELYLQKLSGGPIQTIVNDIDAHFDGWFAGDPDSAWDLWARHRSAVGKLAVLFPESIDFHTVMRTGPDLPGRGVVVLDGIDDPALERMRLAIRRASLDTLLARAEAICFGGYRRGQSTEFIVRQWLSGERPQPPLLVWHPNGGSAETGKVLMFLERDADGRWQPVGNGAGELAVRVGRVVRFGRRLDDVIEEIRERSGAASTVLSSR